MEQQFLLDQRSERKMAIGSVDVETTNKNEKEIRRRLEMLKQEGRIDHQESSTSKQEGSVLEQIYFISSDEASDLDESGGSSSSSFEISTRPKLPTTKKTRIKLRALAEACDRTGVSDRGTSFIAFSVLEDVGSIQKALIQ